jgi:hypothetical protein
MKAKSTFLLTVVGAVSMTLLTLCYTSKENLLQVKGSSQTAVRQIVPELFEGLNNQTGTDDGTYWVRNIIQFVRFQQKYFSNVDAVCVLSAFKYQRLDKILFHTAADSFVGPYWEKVNNTPGIVYEFRKVTLQDKIFGQNFSKYYHVYHASDVTRTRILMEYGRIFIDNEVYVVQNLNKFRKFEMALGMNEDKPCIFTHVLIVNKNARFLRLWL